MKKPLRFCYLLQIYTLGIGLNADVFAAENIWSHVKTPSASKTLIYGSASNGCIAGAVKLPNQGLGFQTMRQSRNRHYGHPNLIQLVNELGRFTHQNNQLLLLGDMSQALGGPMPSDHASHQSGLDIDVWLYDMQKSHFKPTDIEQLKMQTTVDKSAGKLNAQWQPIFSRYIEKAASHPNTDRIFVNPVIKQALCRITPDASWLNKVRPWWGHDAHFHVRLKCPAGQAFCQNQPPIPTHSGCDADLEKWVLEQAQAVNAPKSKKTTKSSAIKPKPELPEQCLQLIHTKSKLNNTQAKP